MFRGFSAFALLCMLIAIPCCVYAQAPTANFTTNVSAGCSPVVVQFTDQSTGSPTSWSWDLGNGGTSTLQNPAATYISPGTYTVILTATNANGSSKDTNYITVHTSPTVDFTADTTVTCGSKTVQFTNLTTPGAGGATTYRWDFGNGDSSAAVNPQYTYSSSGNYSVSLIVTNSSGCTKSLTKNNFIKIDPKPATAFAASTTSSCTAPLNVNFTNTTTGAVSYAWDLGNGNTPTTTNPSTTYNSAGTYTVRLISTGSNGCKDTLTKTNYIVIGQVNASFSVPSPRCVNDSLSITNTTTPGLGVSRTWTSGAGQTDTAANPKFGYPAAGTYTITLVENYTGGCSDTATQTITISAKPTAGFTTNDTAGCTVPFNATFTNTSTGATSYAWNFGDGGNSTQTSPSHNYNTLGIYTAILTATNSAGCTSTATKNIKIKVPSGTLSIEKDNVCANTNVNFTATLDSTLSAINYLWDFGDGSSTMSCAGCNYVSHAYSATGTYTATVIISTASGCHDTITTSVTIKPKPVANFSGTPLSICPDGTVNFTNTSTNATSYLWDFGDGGTDRAVSPSHPYDNPGTYDVTLYAFNENCADTMKKSNYVDVKLPLASFVPDYQCTSRLSYTFYDSSIGADTYSWDFGDGNTSATSGTVNHTYATYGTYTVKLTVTNTTSGCTDILVRTIHVVPLNVTFAADDSTICAGDSVTFTRSANPTGVTYTWYYGFGIGYNSNSLTMGSVYSTPGTYTVKMIMTDGKGCKDSVVKTNYVKVGGGTADFTVNPLNACKLSPILFTENSTMGAYAVTNRVWNFGDGSGTFPVTTDTITHIYNNAGKYNVQLIITDANNCKDTVVKNEVIAVHKPTAQFFTADTFVCAGDTIKFNNNSGGTSFTSAWTFGDGNTSTALTPNHVYNALGNYTVKLVVTDTFGCKDSLEKADYVKVQKPTASFTMSDTFGACPPHTIYFTNTSTNSVSSMWTFGNNNQSTFSNPSTTYTYPGTYTVKLVATHAAGCKDSATKTVTIAGPTGSFSYSPLTGCSPVTVQFTATSSNTTTYIWDMNNGVTQNTGTGTFSYTYTKSGLYLPKLVLSDGASCQVPIQNNDTVLVDTMFADFSFTTSGNLCNNDTVFFNDTTFSYTAVTGRSWNFGDGGTSTTTDPSHYYSAPGTYQVTLIVTNANGCKDTVVKSITVNALPAVAISTSTDSICGGLPTGTQLTASGATTYAWAPATGLSCTNCANPMANPSANTTYIVTGTDNNGCKDTDTITIKIKPKPVVSVSNDTTVCNTASAQLQATGAFTYAWSPATGLSCTNCANPVATPAATTTYTVIGTNASGCKDTADVTVTVVTKPAVSAGTNKTICNGDSVQLTATGATTYTWTPGATLSCTGCAAPYAKPGTTTSYTVIGSLGNGCADTATVTVNVNALPNVSAGSNTSICTGSSTTLQATGANTYTWTPATGLSCTNCAAPTANPTTTTVYTVTGTDANGCKDTGVVTVTVNALPTVSAGGDKTVCPGFGTTLQATGAVSYTWTPATGLSCTNCAAPTATPSVTTTYTVTGTDANGCKNTATAKVTVHTPPVVSGGGNKTICSGDSVQLQATGATSYIWSPAAGLSCTPCANPKASPAATTGYTVIGTDVNGCKDTATVTVNVNNLPTIGAGANKAICAGGSVQLQATGGVSYTWAPATGLSCTNCPNPVASPSATTVYTISGTDANGCKNTGQITVTVNSLPNVGAGSNQSVCLYDSVQLQATGAVSYTWSPAAGLSCTGCANPKASPAANATYTVTGTDANGCVNTSSVTVSVKPLPVVTALKDTTICFGSSTPLQASGASSYSWQPAFGLSCINCANPVATPTATTSYRVIGTAPNACTDTDTVVIKVNLLPTIGAGGPHAICKGDTLQLQATGGVTYTWAPANKISCTNCPDPKVYPDTNSVYTITGIDTNGCKNTATVAVNVKPIPAVNATIARSKICLGDTTQLQASGATSYSWSPAGTLSCTFCPNPVATPAGRTIYIVTGTVNGCSDTAAVAVDIIVPPKVSAGPDVSYCEGGSVTLQATGASNYTWTPATGLSCTNCSTTVATPVITTTYTLTGVDSYGCSSEDKIIVTVNKLPVIDAGTDKTHCEGDSVQLTVSGAASYVWSPGTGLSCSNCPSPKASVPGPVTYTITGTDANGCTNTDQVNVDVILKQPTSFGGDDSICVGEEVTLSATGGTTYNWFPGEGLSDPTAPNPVASPTHTTQYRIIIRQGDCFADTGTATIWVFDLPEIDAGPDQTLKGGNELKLEARSQGAASYEWTPAEDLSCSDCLSPVVTPKRTTTYHVKAISKYGCVAEDDVTVFVACGADQVFIPNTFTPNGDGLNDRFYPQGRGFQVVKRFSVYNRWGELIFDAKDMPLNDPNYGWDGRYKSEPLKPDVFVYILRAECENGEPVEIKGDISLIR